ncbi:unnamed protein product [Caretta caretta]
MGVSVGLKNNVKGIRKLPVLSNGALLTGFQSRQSKENMVDAALSSLTKHITVHMEGDLFPKDLTDKIQNKTFTPYCHSSKRNQEATDMHQQTRRN